MPTLNIDEDDDGIDDGCDSDIGGSGQWTTRQISTHGAPVLSKKTSLLEAESLQSGIASWSDPSTSIYRDKGSDSSMSDSRVKLSDNDSRSFSNAAKIGLMILIALLLAGGFVVIRRLYVKK